MPDSSFIEKLNQNYFGLKTYHESAECPLKPEEIDQRFFNDDGKPKETLLERVSKLKRSLIEHGFLTTQFEIYVVGGVTKKAPKTCYSGDLDLYVHIPSIPETIIKYEEESNNLATQLIKKINPLIPDENGRKSGTFTDVMVSKYPPMGQLPLTIGEEKVVFNATKSIWTTIEGFSRQNND